MIIGQLEQESSAYRAARMKLLEEEIALRDQAERVAALRRELPLDTAVKDYILKEGPTDLANDEPIVEKPLSTILSPEKETLILYQFMYGGAQETPCPGCSMWCDGLSATAPHIEQHVDFALVTSGPLTNFRALARERNWSDIRLLSSEDSDMKRDLGFETPEGCQLPGISVFVRGTDGAMRHAYSQSALIGDDKRRGLDLLSPVWNLLDYTPYGRGDWFPKLNYA